MKKWVFPLCVIAFFIFVTALFLTPDFTHRCTDQLLICVNRNVKLGFWLKLWKQLVCIYHNVVCVLGGLFV